MRNILLFSLLLLFSCSDNLLQVSGTIHAHADNTYDLGTSSKRWRNLYTTDLQLSNESKKDDGWLNKDDFK